MKGSCIIKLQCPGHKFLTLTTPKGKRKLSANMNMNGRTTHIRRRSTSSSSRDVKITQPKLKFPQT